MPIVGKAVRFKRWVDRKRHAIEAYKSEPFILGHLVARYGPLQKGVPEVVQEPFNKLQEKRREAKSKLNDLLNKMGVPKTRILKD